MWAGERSFWEAVESALVAVLFISGFVLILGGFLLFLSTPGYGPNVWGLLCLGMGATSLVFSWWLNERGHGAESQKGVSPLAFLSIVWGATFFLFGVTVPSLPVVILGLAVATMGVLTLVLNRRKQSVVFGPPVPPSPRVEPPPVRPTQVPSPRVEPPPVRPSSAKLGHEYFVGEARLTWLRHEVELTEKGIQKLKQQVGGLLLLRLKGEVSDSAFKEVLNEIANEHDTSISKANDLKRAVESTLDELGEEDKQLRRAIENLEVRFTIGSVAEDRYRADRTILVTRLARITEFGILVRSALVSIDKNDKELAAALLNARQAIPEAPAPVPVVVPASRRVEPAERPVAPPVSSTKPVRARRTPSKAKGQARAKRVRQRKKSPSTSKRTRAPRIR